MAAALALGAAACGHSPSSAAPADAGVRGEALVRASLDAAGATPPADSTPTLTVGRAKGPIDPTGRFDVDVWGGAVNTRTLLDSRGVGAVPVSECRFLWGQGNLYVFFYAGDLNLQVHATKHDGPV